MSGKGVIFRGRFCLVRGAKMFGKEITSGWTFRKCFYISQKSLNVRQRFSFSKCPARSQNVRRGAHGLPDIIILAICKGGVHICRVANGDLTWETLSYPKSYTQWYIVRIGHIFQLQRARVVFHVDNIWIGPWANFPHYMDPTLYAIEISLQVIMLLYFTKMSV